MFVTNWISTTKIQKISEITNFFRHYFLSRTEVNNYTPVTACYWKNNHEQGIGYNNKSTKATKVDGSVVTWQKAVDAMNTALQNAGSEWRYELKGALPTLMKQ